MICSICNKHMNDPVEIDRADAMRGDSLVVVCDSCNWGAKTLPVPYLCLQLEPWQVLEGLKGLLEDE